MPLQRVCPLGIRRVVRRVVRRAILTTSLYVLLVTLVEVVVARSSSQLESLLATRAEAGDLVPSAPANAYGDVVDTSRWFLAHAIFRLGLSEFYLAAGLLPAPWAYWLVGRPGGLNSRQEKHESGEAQGGAHGVAVSVEGW